MKKFVVLALTVACGVTMMAVHAPQAHAQKSQALKIKSAVMSKGYDGDAVGVTNTFKPTDLKIHCVVKLNRVATVTATGKWYAVDAGGEHNLKFVEASLPKQLVDTLHFNASLPRPWPAGKYRVDVYVNGKMMRSLPYTIAK